ncbi:MAG: hypothetical protein AAF616_15385 [Bacteroidota bacterium]
MKSLKFSIALLFTFVLSCEDHSDTIQLSELESEKELAKDIFENQILDRSNSHLSARTGKSRKTINKDFNWDEAYFKTTSFGQVIIVPIIFEEPLYIPKGDHSLSLEQLNYAMFYEGESGYELLWVTALPDQDFLSHNEGVDQFTGNVFVEDWYGNYIDGFSYSSEGVEKIDTNSSARDTNECAVVSIFYCTEVCIGDNCGEIRCKWSHNEVTCPDAGGGMPPSDNPGDFPPDEVGPGGGPYEDGNPDSDDFPDPGSLDNSMADQWEEELCYKENIIDNDCVMDVIGKMSDLNVGYEVLTNFLGDEPTVDSLCFDIVDLESRINGNTTLSGTYSNPLITINLNSLNLNRSQLSIARTLLHEMIHAELLGMVVQAGGYSNFQNYAQNYNVEFLALWDYIDEYNVNGWQHEYMADYYIQYMASGLRKLEESLVSNSFKNAANGGYFNYAINEDWSWSSFYNFMAWEGLHMTEQFQIDIINTGLKTKYYQYRNAFESGNSIDLRCQ